MNLKVIYDYMANNDRDEALDNAEAVAKLTIPTIAPKGEKIAERPYTNEGTRAVRSLASALDYGMFPPGTTSFNVQLKDTLRIELEASNPQLLKELIKRLEQRRDEVASSLQRKSAKSRLIASIRRVLIEGTTLFVVMDDRIDVYPLRDIVVERESGVPRIVIARREITADPMKLTDKKPENDKPICTYTLFNFEKGEVWYQSDEWEEQDPTARRIDEPPKEGEEPDPDLPHINIRQAVLAVGEVPDIGDYPEGYAYHYLPLIAFINHLDSGLGEAVAIASWNLLRATPGSPIAQDTDSLKTKKSGDVVVADKEDLEWLNTAVKLGDFAFLAQLRPAILQILNVAFSMGLADRQMTGQPQSATAILEIISDIHKQTQDLGSTLEETMHRPLIAAEMYVFEQRNPLLAGLDIPEGQSAMVNPEALVDIQIISGANALEEQRRERQFILQEFPMLKTLDPALMLDGKKAADMFTARTRMQKNGLYYRLSAEQQAQMAMLAAGGGTNGAKPAEGRREHMLMTAGGPQPPQPPQGAPPAGPSL